MRTETKIALGLFAAYSVLGYLLAAPEFLKGMLIGLSIFFMIIGLLSESAYRKVKVEQVRKITYLKGLIRIN